MTAARLREAATLLRERAESTTTRAAWTQGHFWVEDYDPNDPSGQTSMQVEIGGMLADGDAAFYSMMSPTVALALADWLVWMAKASENGLLVGTSPAIAVANAILGDRE